MKHKTRTKALSWLLSLALTLIPALGGTARADLDPEKWSHDVSYVTAGEYEESLGVNVTADVTLTLNEGAKLTVEKGITVATGKTLTVTGAGTLIVNGSDGGDGVNGDVTINSGSVTVTGGNGPSTPGKGISGNVTVNGGSATVTGGIGQYSGGIGINGSVTVTGGIITVTGGKGNMQFGRAVTGTITGSPAKESNDGYNWYDMSGNTSESIYVKVGTLHNHDFAYSADGATITATCSAENCPLENHTATLTIKPPANLVYDNKAKAATVENNINSDELTITYTQNNAEVAAANVKDKGTYTASVTLEGQTASVTFEITDPTYTITIPATLDVKNAGWNATAGITASGAIAEGKMLSVTASSGDEFAMVNGNNKIAYKLAQSGNDATTYANATAKTTWNFSVAELLVKDGDENLVGTNKPMGAVVEEYINKPAGDYTDTVTFTAELVDATKSITIPYGSDKSIELTYDDNDTWAQIVEKNPDKIAIKNNHNIVPKADNSANLIVTNPFASVGPTDRIDPTRNYQFSVSS